jgi:cytochrome c-type biogenesis protein CcmH
MLFWILAAAMLLVAIAIIVIPVLRGRVDSGPSRKDINIELYRNQVAQLEKDLAEGRIDRESFDTAKQEIDLNLLSDTEREETAARNDSGRTPAIATLQPVSYPPTGLPLCSQSRP